MISLLNHDGTVHALGHVAGNIRPACTPTITLALVTLCFLVSFFGQAAQAGLPTTQALAAFGIMMIANASTNTYFLDSGCSTSIMSNKKYLQNLCKMEPVQIKGFNSNKTLHLMADLHLPVVDDNRSPIMIVIPNIFYYPSGEINLISSNDVNKTD
mmetsp:Transcript_3499/g.5073  ORF Transcript_3499/g.5073 Transcript_3499/m.5073 type:complete len:156 (-) Transcript_3499:1373-1840(-)